MSCVLSIRGTWRRWRADALMMVNCEKDKGRAGAIVGNLLGDIEKFRGACRRSIVYSIVEWLGKCLLFCACGGSEFSSKREENVL